MLSHPLSKPSKKSSIYKYFVQQTGSTSNLNKLEKIEHIIYQFSKIPYENLTKIIKYHQEPQNAKRDPSEVLHDYFNFGAGGTCFSLSVTLLHLIRALGFEAYPILADRSYGENTHSALLVKLEGKLHLIDPGYMILKPISLPEEEDAPVHIQTSFNDLILKQKNAQRIDLFTTQGGQNRYRVTYKISDRDEISFLKAWDASFDWDMMHYPILTKLSEEGQIFLNKDYLQRRSHQNVDREKLPLKDLVDEIGRIFGLQKSIVLNAIKILNEEGCFNG